jgi:hypothetical protein
MRRTAERLMFSHVTYRMVFAKFTVGGSPACNCLPVLDQVGPFLGRKGVLNFFHPAFETTKKKLPLPFLTANAGGLCVSSHKHINISASEKCGQLRIWRFQECHEWLHRSVGFLTLLVG